VSGPRLRFYGVRGSVPVPGPGTVRFGGNTPCVVLEDGLGGLVILDAGSGIRILGADLAASGHRGAIDLLLSHTHWDHIAGLPFFLPLYDPAAHLRITGPRQTEGLRATLERLARWENFPIPSERWLGLREVREVGDEPFGAGGWQVRATGLCHPGRTLGYRLARPGSETVAYVTDNELLGGAHGVTPGWRGDLVDFLRGCETLVHDATWADGEEGVHAGWGHSSPAEAIRLAAEVGCRRLVLFHHNPEHDDDAMDRQVDLACRTAADLAPGLEVVAAREGSALALKQEV
jgi:phosphoribosyl 1,2-cyclic phosphodiesterase